MPSDVIVSSVLADTHASKMVVQSVVDALPHVIFWRDKTGKILGCNRAFCSMLDLISPESAIGLTIDDLHVAVHDVDLLKWCDQEVMSSDAPAEGVINSLLQHDGQLRKYKVKKEIIRDAFGRFVALIGVYVDISTHVKDAENQRHAMRLNQRLADIVSGFNVMGARHLTDEFTDLCRAGLDELPLDRVLVMKLSDDEQALQCTVMVDHFRSYENYFTFYRSAFPEIFKNLMDGNALFVNDVHNSAEISCMLESYLIPNSISAVLVFPIVIRGRVWGCVAFEKQHEAYLWSQYEEFFAQSLAHMMALSVTTYDNIKVREELEEKNELYDLLLTSTRDGIWDWNLITNALYMSPRWFEMHGYVQFECMGMLDRFVELIHPDDVERVFATVDKHFVDGVDIAECRFRIRNFEGNYCWVMSRGAAIRNAEGVPVRMVGTTTDIHSIKMAEEGLLRQQEYLQKRVDEQTADLIKAKDMAESANLAKSEFLANMSHELRTPMHAIINYSSMGMNKIDTVELDKLKKYFKNINVSGERLLVLINDLLDLSKMEANRMDFAFEYQDISVVVASVQNEIASLLEKKQLQFTVQYDTQSTAFRFDKQRIVQVLINILSNAIKFTPEQKSITLRIYDTQIQSKLHGACAAVGLDVLDNGCGIPESELEHVFDKFAQSSTTKTGAGGTGLGLAISRQIANAHGGEIIATNRPEGGCCFTVLLPRVKE